MPGAWCCAECLVLRQVPGAGQVLCFARLSSPRPRALVGHREPQRECRAAADFARDRDRAVELFDDPFRNRQSEPETAAFGRDEVVENRRQAFGRNTGSGIRHGNLHVIAGRAVAIVTLPPAAVA